MLTINKLGKSTLLVFVGPDGSGKTTIIENLRLKLSPKYEVKINHIRFNIIPRAGHLKAFLLGLLRFKFSSFKMNSASKLGVSEGRYVYGPKFPFWKIMPLLCYEIFDFILAYFYLFKCNNTRIILFDRYFYDYYTEKDWSNTPSWLMNFLCFFAPEPDWVFFMENTPEEINKRKNELSIDDIAFVNSRTTQLLGNKSNFVSIDTNQSPDEIAKFILTILSEQKKYNA